MKLINNTTYTTKSLKALFHACHKMVDVIVKAKKLRVHIDPSRSRVTGITFLNGAIIWIGIPKKKCLSLKDGKVLERIVAWVFMHELLHCDGVDHHQMNKDWYPYHKSKLAIASWADNYELVEKRNGKPRKSPLDKCEQNLEHARKMIKRHEIRGKREETLIKKWEKKVRYYERRLKLLKIN